MIFLNKMDKVKINIVHLPKKNIEIDDGEEYHISTFLSTNILTGASPDKVLILSTDVVPVISTNKLSSETPVISTDVVPDETPVISTDALSSETPVISTDALSDALSDVVPDEVPVISTDALSSEVPVISTVHSANEVPSEAPSEVPSEVNNDEIKLLIKNKQYDELRKILPPIAYQIIMEKEVGRSLPTPTGCLKEYKELYRKKQTTPKETKQTTNSPKKSTTTKLTTTKQTTPKQTMTNSYVEQMKNKHKIKSTIINTRGSSISSNDYVTLMKRRHGAG